MGGEKGRRSDCDGRHREVGDETDETDSGPGGFPSVTSSVKFSSMLGEGDNSDDVEIVKTQIGASTSAAFDLMNRLSEEEIEDYDEEELQTVHYGGFG